MEYHNNDGNITDNRLTQVNILYSASCLTESVWVCVYVKGVGIWVGVRSTVAYRRRRKHIELYGTDGKETFRIRAYLSYS